MSDELRIPNSKPKGRPDSEVVSFYKQPPLEIYIEPGYASKETIRAVFEAISDWHIASGGLGLEFSSDGYFMYVIESASGWFS
ncbi:MAG: hypothetical protein GY774_06330 [Planctomycetes bacterium]|nr:hypothetical protein [Planctomycetota bacterium]